MRCVGTLAYVLAGLVLAVNVFMYAVRAYWRRRHPRHDTDEPLGLLDAAWAFVKECAATTAAVLLMPIGWLLPECRTGSGMRGPIILVSGPRSRGALWLMRRRLLRDGFSPVCVLESCSKGSEHRTPSTEHRPDVMTARIRSVLAVLNSFGPTRKEDVELAAERLRAAVSRLAEAGRPQPVALVGYGVGGIVLRYYARRYPTPYVRRLMTLGTPHFGTVLAKVIPGSERGLVPGSALLHTLNTADRVPRQFDAVAIHSAFDAFIVPPDSAEYPEAFNIRVYDVGHHMLLFSAKVYALLRENLEAPLQQ